MTDNKSEYLPEILHTRSAGRPCPGCPARVLHKEKKNRDKLRRRFLCADPAAEVRGRYCPMKKKISRNCRLISLMNRQFAGVFSVFHLETGDGAFQETCDWGCRFSGSLQSGLLPFRRPATGAAAFQIICNRGRCPACIPARSGYTRGLLLRREEWRYSSGCPSGPT